MPPSAADYARARSALVSSTTPATSAVLSGSASLAGLDSVAAKKNQKRGRASWKTTGPVQPEKIINLQDGQVREGEF